MNAVSSYLHYHIDNYDGPQGLSLNVEEAKQKILDRFLSTFISQQKGVNSSTDLVTKEKAIDFLEQMSSSGAIGSKLVQDLSSINFVNSSFGTTFSRISTGAGIASAGSTNGIAIPQAAVNLLSEVNDRLNMMIDVLQLTGQSAYVAMLASLQDGETLPLELLDKNLNGKQFSQAEIQDKDKKMTAAVSKLKENVNSLSQLAKGGSSDIDYNSVMRSVAGCFNEIGGHLYEAVVAFIFEHADETVRREVIPALARDFEKTGRISGEFFEVTSRILSEVKTTGQNKIDNQEVKGDISMKTSYDGITFQLSGSIKLLQNDDAITGKSLRLKNIHNGMSFGNALTIGLDSAGHSTDILQWFEAHMSAVKQTEGSKKNYVLSSGNGVEQSWENLKEYSKYSVALRMLTGSGDFTKDDFASILVVNNKIFSMYSILQKLSNNFDEYATIGGGWNSTNLIGHRSQIMKAVKKDSVIPTQENVSKRLVKTKELLAKLYNRKITMSLNLSKIMSAI